MREKGEKGDVYEKERGHERDRSGEIVIRRRRDWERERGEKGGVYERERGRERDRGGWIELRRRRRDWKREKGKGRGRGWERNGNGEANKGIDKE